MDGQTSLIPVERIERAILLIRGEKVMLDIDLAAIYDVTTKRLNEQVKRNLNRFPPDFMFQLTAAEKAEVVANCDHLIRLRFSSYLPYAFTEHGALMLANVLNSERAAQTSVMVVRAFVRLRQILASEFFTDSPLRTLKRSRPCGIVLQERSAPFTALHRSYHKRVRHFESLPNFMR